MNDKLPIVGNIRISRDLRTLVLEVDSGFGTKIYLANVQGLQDVIAGYQDYVNIVEGKKFENPVLEKTEKA